MSDTKTLDERTSAVDKAIALANARKAAKLAAGGDAKPAKAAKAPAKVKPTDAERAEAKAKLDAERAERKAAKAAERDAKKAATATARKPAHLSKVAKAGEKLPALSAEALEVFGAATAGLDGAQLGALALHLQHFNRVRATERALTAKVEEGDAVTIVGGDPRFIGMVGVISKAQRIRCYVDVEGHSKPIYCFTSDVEAVSAAETAPAGDEPIEA